MNKKWAAVVPAAGFGRRFSNEQAKQFYLVAGLPVLVHSVSRFLGDPDFIEITVAVPQTAIDATTGMFERYLGNDGDKISVVAGGATRKDSVYAALKAVQTADFVAVHDAARPNISPKLLKALKMKTEEMHAALPVVPVTDTVKWSKRGDTVDKTLDRRTVFLAQTPQCFAKDLLLSAFSANLGQNFTDEASLVEMTGHPVAMVEGDRSNLKLTHPEDLHYLERLLEPPCV